MTKKTSKKVSKKDSETKLSETSVKDKVKIVKELATELLSLMGTSAKIEVYEDKDNEAVKVDIKSEEELGLIIGKRGETLLSIQSVLGMMVRQKTSEWVRIIVNVGDWREKEEQYLENLAMQTADRAKDTGEAQELYNLSSSQRRIVHMVLAKVDDVKTESLGEGKGRYLIVKPEGK